MYEEHIINNSCITSGTQTIELWRYVDPEMGPRVIPNLNNPLVGKEQIPSSAVFNVNVDSRSVEVSVDGKCHPVGSQIIYIVK